MYKVKSAFFFILLIIGFILGPYGGGRILLLAFPSLSQNEMIADGGNIAIWCLGVMAILLFAILSGFWYQFHQSLYGDK